VVFALKSQGKPGISGKNALPLVGETCHAFAMAKFKLLQDLYRFPGFVPLPRIRGVFGEPAAVLLTLLRRRKKLCAASVGRRTAVITTSGRGASATSPVATNASTSSSSFAASGARGAGA